MSRIRPNFTIVRDFTSNENYIINDLNRNRIENKINKYIIPILKKAGINLTRLKILNYLNISKPILQNLYKSMNNIYVFDIGLKFLLTTYLNDELRKLLGTIYAFS